MENNTKNDLLLHIDKSKPVDEQVKEYVNALAMEKAVQNQELVNKLTEAKKDQLESNAQADLKAEQTNLQRAEYDVYEGIATYAGIKKPLPKKYQRFLFTLYMIALFPFQLVVGTVFCIVNFFADCVDNFMQKMSSIARSARVLVYSCLALLFVAIVIQTIISLSEKYIQ